MVETSRNSTASHRLSKSTAKRGHPKERIEQSTTSQQQHSSGFDLGVTATGSWGPVSISTTANYNVQNSASTSQQTSRNQSNDLTRKASSRSKKEHKVSFKVASASGTEDQAVRKITNPFRTRRTRLLSARAQWRGTLTLTAAQTYVLRSPEPGSNLSKIAEIGVNGCPAGRFGAPLYPALGAVRLPADISCGIQGSEPYGTPVEPPPAEDRDGPGVHAELANKLSGADEYTTF